MINNIKKMLDIRKVLNEVCDDCIGNILEYIDPIDILKLIYYNKYRLYLNKKCNVERKVTTDSTQLLLYKKFYEGVTRNMEEYVIRHKKRWSKITKLLDNKTVISGGFLLRAIYGPIDTTTVDLPLDFYYEEEIYKYEKINKHRCSYRTADIKNITTLTDIDIYTMSNEKIFDTSKIKRIHESTYLDEAEKEDGTYIKIFNICIGNTIMNGIIDIDRIKTLNKKEFEHIDGNCEGTMMVGIGKDVQAYVYVWNYVKAQKFIIKNYNDLLNYCIEQYGQGLTQKMILYYVANNPHMVEKCDVDLPIAVRQLRNAISRDEDELLKILFHGGNPFLKKLHNSNSIYEKYDSSTEESNNEYDFEDYMRYPIDLIMYNSLELAEQVCKYNQHVKTRTWRESLCDPYTKLYKYLIKKNNGNNKELYYGRSKKIIPIIEKYGDELLLNIIYVDEDQYKSPHQLIENEFDIDICRQTFDGSILKLYSVPDLIKKVCRYNTGYIENHMEDAKYNLKKYICFRKRLEKYKVLGFAVHDEQDTIRKVKKILNIQF